MNTQTYPAASGETVTERDARTCRDNGHAGWTKDGVDTGLCARCGDSTLPDELDTVNGRTDVEWDSTANMTREQLNGEDQWSLPSCNWCGRHIRINAAGSCGDCVEEEARRARRR